MSATPVGSSAALTSRATSASRSPASASSAKGSGPTEPTIATSAPSRAAATAWFAPFPPGKRSKLASLTVSPGCGSRAQRATRSRLMLPTTVKWTVLCGKRAQVVNRAVQEVLAQVEKARPERSTVGSGGEPRRCRETFEGAHENSQLEIRMGDACGRRRDAGPAQDSLPLQDLAGSGFA